MSHSSLLMERRSDHETHGRVFETESPNGTSTPPPPPPPPRHGTPHPVTRISTIQLESYPNSFSLSTATAPGAAYVSLPAHFASVSSPNFIAQRQNQNKQTNTPIVGPENHF